MYITNAKKKGYDAKVIELPKNKKVNRKETHNKKIWLYGLPCSGKTFLANQFPNVLMLNTDGNIGQVDAPAIPRRRRVEDSQGEVGAAQGL